MSDLTKISQLLRAFAGLPQGLSWVDGEILFRALVAARCPWERRAEGSTGWEGFPMNPVVWLMPAGNILN